VGLCALVALATLSRSALAEVKVRDDRGVTVTFASAPRRIVSLLPSLTESICDLSACERLVGTDRFSDWPASVAALPKLGGLEDAQIERIVALEPDVVLVSISARVINRLEGLGLKVIALESRSHADVKRTLTLLAQILGPPADATPVWAEVERETRTAAARVPAGLRGKRVYFEVDATPYAAGPTSFIGETLAELGLANALPTSLGPFPKLNPEYVVRLQPDIILADRQSLAGMPKRPGWPSLHALVDRQTCGFPAGAFELIGRPGPRMGEAAGALADCLVAIATRTKGD
jgi:iron complex transport system substrate-binding protein